MRTLHTCVTLTSISVTLITALLVSKQNPLSATSSITTEAAVKNVILSSVSVLKEKPSFYGLPENVPESIAPEVSVLKNSKLLLIPAALGGLAYLASWRQRRLKENEE